MGATHEGASSLFFFKEEYGEELPKDGLGLGK